MRGKSKGILGNWIVRNIVLAILAVLALVLVVSILLAMITQHNREIEVPDFSNLTFKEASVVASSAGLRVVNQDSLYIRRLKKGVVYSQNPAAGSMVKRGRRVQLSTNTFTAKKIPMPALVGFSMRQAKAELQRNGLVLGKLVYVSDIATNYVLGQKLRGRDIAAGKMVESGSTIDLVVGLSDSERMTVVPDLIGKPYQRAVDLILENSLNTGRIRFDATVKTYADSLNAVVYSQSPGGDAGSILMGSQVSLRLK